jgi:GTP diphosphokinase / guanosine-3',5'-bis(diphosphate) 3'-diphosphatase
MSFSRDLDLIIRAAHFAAHKHRDQRRKDFNSTPYMNYPLTEVHGRIDMGGLGGKIVLLPWSAK